MQSLTPEEQSAIAPYLTDSRSRFEFFFQYAIYFVPSLVFGLYGMWKGDMGAMAVAYVVLVCLIAYLILYQARGRSLLRSAIGKLVENCGLTGQPSNPPPP